MRVMSAGDGYNYLLQSVAAGDGHRPLTTPLIRYYTEKGTPPGYWLGTGVHGLGTIDRRIEPGGTVTEDHLRRLLGQGHDPVTDDPLGLSYFRHRTVEERVAARVEHLDPELSAEERATAVERIEAEERERGSRRTVAGYDYTFSVPKSVSALWAVADPAVQARIVGAHHAAVADVVALMERDVAATRVGHAGVAQVATRGLIATCYDHYDSRAADPQLHTHVVIANKVQGEDGKWRSLDGRPIHQAVVAISEHYNAVLADHLTRSLETRWEQRERGRDRNPAWEIVGVPDELIAEFSSRSAAIEAETDRLIGAYRAEHGHRPDQRTVLRLRQQATLSTRPDKTHWSLAELTGRWRRRADRVLGQDAASWADRLLSTSGATVVVRAEDVGRDEVAALGQVVVEQVQEKRSTWGRWNLSAEASRQTMGLRFGSVSDREAVIRLIADAAEVASLRLTPPELTVAPAAFTRSDGSSMFRPRHAILYTSTALLAAEDRLLHRSRTTTAPALDPTNAARVAGAPGEQGRVLSPDQRRVVERIATSGRTVDVLVGPAGAGKTLALGALRRAWEDTHGPGSVIGLAPSAALCGVLQHQGAEKSAHETIEAEQEKWSSIAQLAAEYETIAQAAQHQRFAAAVAASGLAVRRATAAVDGDSFGSLVAQLRRSEADGHQPEQLLSRAVRAGGLDGAEDLAAVLAARIAKPTAARSGGTRPRRRPRYVAGLIPEALGAMPADMHRTLTELRDLIDQRATALTSQAVQEGEAWVRRLGAPPTDPARRAAWEEQLRTIAAYRDRYGITSTDPLGPTPSSQGQRLDHRRADAATHRAQATASNEPRRRHGLEQQIDSGRDLSR